EADDVLFVMQYLRILWKHKWVLLLSLVLGGLVGVGISLYTTPMYSSSATMEIPNATEPFSSGALARTDPTLTTQSQLLSSRKMRQRAMAKLAGKNGQLPEVEEPLAA